LDFLDSKYGNNNPAGRPDKNYEGDYEKNKNTAGAIDRQSRPLYWDEFAGRLR
jgi:hypothetical protein